MRRARRNSASRLSPCRRGRTTHESPDQERTRSGQRATWKQRYETRHYKRPSCNNTNTFLSSSCLITCDNECKTYSCTALRGQTVQHTDDRCDASLTDEKRALRRIETTRWLAYRRPISRDCVKRGGKAFAPTVTVHCASGAHSITWLGLLFAHFVLVLLTGFRNRHGTLPNQCAGIDGQMFTNTNCLV